MTVEYAVCDACAGWITKNGAVPYVVVATKDHKTKHLHDGACRERWFDQNYGTVTSEVGGKK